MVKASELKAQQRTAKKKGAARQLRMKGLVPGIMYGAGKENRLISLEAKEIRKALAHSGTVLFKLAVEGEAGEPHLTMVKEVQRHPVSEKLLHVDFQEIAADQEIAFSVPIHVVGAAAGVSLGGILQLVRREVLVKCLPDQIPEHIAVDVTKLEIGHSIHSDELTLPSGVKLQEPERLTIVAVVAPKAVRTPEEEAAAAAEAAEGEAAAEAGAGAADKAKAGAAEKPKAGEKDKAKAD